VNGVYATSVGARCSSITAAGTNLSSRPATSVTEAPRKGRSPLPSGRSGGSFPAAYRGALFFSDRLRDCIYALLPGNDATLAGLAEARTGAAVGAGAALHLMVEVGIGGAFTVDGRPSTGAHGAAGEYGHQPYGDRSLFCPCGARGCWDLAVDGRALARHLGAPAPADPRAYARRVLDRAPGDAAARRALAEVAAALGAGIGALVNVHDPDTVTLGGLAAPLRAAAPQRFAAAYTDGLMAFHRGQPPPVVDAVHGDDGALHGAAILALDEVTSEAALAGWSARADR